jgi:hypothetical protein
MGQSAHPGRARGRWSAAWTAVAVMAGALTLAGCSTSVAAATTTLRAASQVTVVRTDGSTVSGVSGMTLRRGDVVRTGSAGRAELVTRARVVFVGSQASVQVLDGARQQLRQGAVVVDAQNGPGLSLTLAGLDVWTAQGAATRAERAVTVRVGALAGPATRVVSDTGRPLTIPALYQAVAGGDALPDAPTPLRLTDDAGEAHAVPALVRDDQTLQTLAAGIDATGRSTARVVTTAWQGPVGTVPRGVARSEQLMPIVLAAAGGRSAAVARYHRAVAWRQAGGSWGVVAHLLGVRASAVVGALAAFERTQPAGVVGSVPAIFAALAGGSSVGHGVPAAGGSGGSRGPGGSVGSSGSVGSGGSGPAPSPSPSPSDVVTSAVASVDGTVSQMLSVVPTPTATPTTPTPTPLYTGVTSALPAPSVP